MSYDEAPANQQNDDASSLQARRARLRGSLAKQAIPPDPYKPDPYMTAAKDPQPVQSNQDPAAVQPAASRGNQVVSEAASEKKEIRPASSAPGTNGQGQAPAPLQASPLFVAGPVPAAAPATREASAGSSPFTQDSHGGAGSSPFTQDSHGGAGSSPFTQDSHGGAGSSPFTQDSHGGAGSSPFTQDSHGGAGSSPFTQDSHGGAGSSPFTQDSHGGAGSSPFAQDSHASAANSPFSQSHSYQQAPPTASSPFVTNGSAGDGLAPPTAAGHAEPTAQTVPAGPDSHVSGQSDSPFRAPASSGSAMSTLSDSLANLRATNAAAGEVYKNAVSANEEKEENTTRDRRSQKTIQEPAKSFKEGEVLDDAFQAPAVIPPNDPNKTSVTVQSIHLQDPLASSSAAQVQVIELLNNMDQAMGACAMNLSALQKAAGEQTEALRSLTETLQHQTFSELGLNLTSLMESLSAALEPMKAVGELVPAIDQLVSVMEAKVVSEEPTIKVGPDQLVIALADQLGAGVIDPWTFKSAYSAVFPDDQPADLLHRLVELLGAQRLSGDLFRSAYDAVQAPEPPQRAGIGHAVSGEKQIVEVEKEVIKVVQDEALVQQLEQLKRSQESFEGKMKQRETEFAEMLGAKEQELQEAQELLNSRWEEFNARYDELTESLQKRDEVIKEKETELARKESENVQLRAQMEELREMMTELQKQFSGKSKEDSQKSAAGFFDTAPGAQAQPAQSASLFDAAPSKPLFQSPGEAMPAAPAAQPVAQNQNLVNQAVSQPVPQPAPQAPPQPAPQPMPQPVMPAPSTQAVPRQAQVTTPFAGAGPGSYGSGVRAQVFEVIVRQALAGAPWREICAGPMQVNNISPDEVEAEVKRRQALLGKK